MVATVAHMIMGTIMGTGMGIVRTMAMGIVMVTPTAILTATPLAPAPPARTTTAMPVDPMAMATHMVPAITTVIQRPLHAHRMAIAMATAIATPLTSPMLMLMLILTLKKSQSATTALIIITSAII